MLDGAKPQLAQEGSVAMSSQTAPTTTSVSSSISLSNLSVGNVHPHASADVGRQGVQIDLDGPPPGGIVQRSAAVPALDQGQDVPPHPQLVVQRLDDMLQRMALGGQRCGGGGNDTGRAVCIAKRR